MSFRKIIVIIISYHIIFYCYKNRHFLLEYKYSQMLNKIFICITLLFNLLVLTIIIILKILKRLQ